MPKADHLIPTAQAAKMLGVDIRTVHRMADDGRLPVAVKIPGRTGAYLFDEADVAALTEQRVSA